MADKPTTSPAPQPKSTPGNAIPQHKLMAMGQGPKPSGPKTPA